MVEPNPIFAAALPASDEDIVSTAQRYLLSTPSGIIHHSSAPCHRSYHEDPREIPLDYQHLLHLFYNQARTLLDRQGRESPQLHARLEW
jgi:hypothetical protein